MRENPVEMFPSAPSLSSLSVAGRCVAVMAPMPSNLAEAGAAGAVS